MTVALVTGGGGGIGRAIAFRLAEEGADLIVVDIDAEAGELTAAQVRAMGTKAVFRRADVSDSQQMVDCVEYGEAALGPITAFVNNAGIEGVVRSIAEYPEEAFDRVIAVNVRGVFLGLKHVLARMQARDGGAIVNLASTSSIRGRASLAGYVASKHAVLGLSRVAALEVAGSGVRVNAVLPGPVQTRMIESLNRQAQASGGIRRAGSVSYATPQQVADVVAYLLSDRASHVNGAEVVVDGGASVQ